MVYSIINENLDEMKYILFPFVAFIVLFFDNTLVCQDIKKESLMHPEYNEMVNLSKTRRHMTIKLNKTERILPNTTKHLINAPVTDDINESIANSLESHPLESGNERHFLRLENPAMMHTPRYFMVMVIPYEGEVYRCLLRRKNILTDEVRVRTTQGDSPMPEISFYRGVVEDMPDSRVTMTVFDGVFRMLVSIPGKNIEVIHRMANQYIAYDNRDRSVESYDCGFDVERTPQGMHTGCSRVGSDCVELSITCDFQSFLDNGSVNATVVWATSIINDVSAIYDGINVSIVIKEIIVHNTPDQYDQLSGVQAVLDTFVQNTQNNYSGRVATLFSTIPLNAGLAYGLNGICGNFPDFPGPYFVNTSLTTPYSSYPNFSFVVYVVAHELGHVFGAPHTHACKWGPDGKSQIDDCGNVYAINNGLTPEGGECFDPANPIILFPGGGTIMSFCNLDGTGIDLINGFASEVGSLIYDNYTTAPCATGGQCATIPPSNDICADAKSIPVAGICNLFTYDNIMASPSGVANPSCGNPGAGDDVWFVFQATSPEMSVSFNSVTGGVVDAIISIYTGTCNALTEKKCVTASNELLDIKVNGLTVGEDVYIRIIESGSDVEGDFGLCVYDPNLPCHPAFAVLMDLYNSAGGTSWTNKTGWDQGAAGLDCDVCSWYGVTCDNLNRIIGLDLTKNNLVGSVPNTLSGLIYLRTLKLWDNQLSGSFPDIWTNMTDLDYLDMSKNNFTGNLPSSMGNLQKLRVLYVENNNLSGPLLPAIGDLPKIETVWMKNNNFSGCYPGSYLNLCSIKSPKFTNNPNLHDGGAFKTTFCVDGTSGDIDMDGFCFGPNPGDDCFDQDATIYPGAPELCDGKDNNCNGQYDEGLVSTNTFMISGDGDWTVAGNWSAGIVPLACHDVVVPASTTSRIVTIPAGSTGVARSLRIENNSTVVVDDGLDVSGAAAIGVNILPGGMMINHNQLTIKNVGTNAIFTRGVIQNFGTINASNLGAPDEVRVAQGGSINNNTAGVLYLRKPKIY